MTFAGTGASTTVNTVKVENLTLGAELTLNGDDILRLSATTGVFPIENNQSSQIRIYPNPMSYNSILQVYPPVSGEAILTIMDITGKLVGQIPCFLENTLQEFSLSGIERGLYMISIKGKTYQYTGKLLCYGNTAGTVKIEKISNNMSAEVKTEKIDSKGTLATVDMRYYIGNRLKFTGISGNYSTVKTDIPTQDKTITFNFLACSDIDNNDYPVVEIGTQLWMAENLKTIKFNDSTDIPLKTGSEWGSSATPAFCWYTNDAVSFNATYGALYNWYTVNTGKLCPSGWHIPDDAEWTTLFTYLGGESVTGGKLKETGTTHWLSLNVGASNESGFTARPGGYRYILEGSFYWMANAGYWWSSKDYDISNAMYESLQYISSWVVRSYLPKNCGFSVRCLKDN